MLMFDRYASIELERSSVKKIFCDNCGRALCGNCHNKSEDCNLKRKKMLNMKNKEIGRGRE